MAYVPVVDVSRDPDVVGQELDEVCASVGFFQIVGHEVEDAVADRAWNAATEFFDLPLQEKMTAARPSPDYPYGYIPVAGESLEQSQGEAAPPDPKETFNMGPITSAPSDEEDPDAAWVYSPNLWPEVLPELRESWTAYYQEMTNLIGRLMALFARGLGLEPEYFHDKIDGAAHALRAINYPQQKERSGAGPVRAGAHTDYGTVTVLRQDSVGGLEVVDHTGSWVPVEPVRGAFVVNIGDLMARWTNDRWRSTLHRVVDPPVEGGRSPRRQSMPFFANANWSARIACVRTCVASGSAPRYGPVSAGPHLMSKFRRSVSV